jgi:hypothetical protein
MPVAKIDPVETFYSVGSSLVGRALLFFSAGLVGSLVGRVAALFEEWEDFLQPLEVLSRLSWRGFAEECWGVILWPAVSILSTAANNVPLFFVLIISVAITFYTLVWTEEPAPFWWLVLASATALVPVFSTEADISWPSVVVLLAFLLGFGFLGWWALRKYHPEVVEVVGNVVKGDPVESPPPPPRRKAPPGTWPEGVKGFEGEDEEGVP